MQALAIREKKVHVYGTPDLPRKPVQVFFDAEGIEDGRFVYLLGVLVVEGDSQKMHSFWADWPGPRRCRRSTPSWTCWSGREDFALFHYGSYEKKLLRRMRKVVKRKRLVDRLLGQGRERPVRHPRQRVLPHLLQRAEGGGPIPGLHLDGGERLRLAEPGVAGTLGAGQGASAGRTSCSPTTPRTVPP